MVSLLFQYRYPSPNADSNEIEHLHATTDEEFAYNASERCSNCQPANDFIAIWKSSRIRGNGRFIRTRSKFNIKKDDESKFEYAGLLIVTNLHTAWHSPSCWREIWNWKNWKLAREPLRCSNWAQDVLGNSRCSENSGYLYNETTLLIFWGHFHQCKMLIFEPPGRGV